MSKLFCVYDKSKKMKPNKKCDICGVLLCKFCGYRFEGTEIDYCNKCYAEYEQTHEDK